MITGRFPVSRPRRLRANPLIRDMVRESALTARDLIAPLFVREGIREPHPISSMPGVVQHSMASLVRECAALRDAGVPAVLLFGIPEHKDGVGSEAYNDKGIIQQALRALKKDVPGLLLITDVCLCEYTDHGHCGVIRNEGIDNDATLELLAREAVSHAAAGADIIAPSDMMDGRVGRIRGALDTNGFAQTPILSYAAKYASGFYGPFREAADNTPTFGDRRSHQMDPGNAVEALREVAMDIEEGADMVMVKPAIPYLDIVWRVKEAFGLPTAAYMVSGEYAMIRAAEQQGWVDTPRVMLEAHQSIKRAGADMIVTYAAKEIATLLSQR